MTELQKLRAVYVYGPRDWELGLPVCILDYLIAQEQAAAPTISIEQEEAMRILEKALDNVRAERDALRAELAAANARIAELEAHKARVEAMPVNPYIYFDCHGYARGIKKGRFIPAAEGE